jgi:nucleoside-diphosphate-sugar epimerase
MGYKTAVLLDKGTGPVEADLILYADPWPGYYRSLIRLCRAIGQEADIVVTGGDDMWPDPRKRAEAIASEFFQKFPDGFGILQPTGDDLAGTDRICGSPWLGREWIRRAYQGRGPVWGEYLGFFGDEELKNVSSSLGVLWQSPDLVQYHDHWSRAGGPPKTDYQGRNERLYWERDKALFHRRREAGWPGHWPLTRPAPPGLVTVTGAGGFIGHHLVKRLKREGCTVRGVDIHAPEFEPSPADEFRLADLRDPSQAREALSGSSWVFALAANMGGIGFIETHKGEIVRDNSLITLMTLEAARALGVKRLLYASSACVYPTGLQSTPEPVRLREEAAYPADPEDGYGWEKLYGERLCRHYREDFGLETRIARLHNVYGPWGAYDGGREKSPAAICRKVALAGEKDAIEVWGDGRQIRTYCYIDDCVEGLLRLMTSDYADPVNVGTERTVSVDELVDCVARIAGKEIDKRHDLSRPQGVRGRASDNSLARRVLGWEPTTPLEEGLRAAYEWIAGRLSAERATALAR